jgi:hypothetical protein
MVVVLSVVGVGAGVGIGGCSTGFEGAAGCVHYCCVRYHRSIASFIAQKSDAWCDYINISKLVSLSICMYIKTIIIVDAIID